MRRQTRTMKPPPTAIRHASTPSARMCDAFSCAAASFCREWVCPRTADALICRLSARMPIERSAQSA